MLANLPYVAESERARAGPEIVRHEPPGALFGGSGWPAAIARAARAAAPRGRACACWRWRSAQARQGRSRGPCRRAGLPGGAASATWPGIERVVIGERRDERDARATTTPTRLQECVAGGGVAVFPTDTVYGLCCDPNDEQAARRLYALKGRPPVRACAVMFFSLDARRWTGSAELNEPERRRCRRCCPAPSTVLLPNRRSASRRLPERPCQPRSARAASAGGAGTPCSGRRAGDAVQRQHLGRSPTPAAWSRSRAACATASSWCSTAASCRARPSTVIDLRDFEGSGRWHVLREGALATEAVEELLRRSR